MFITEKTLQDEAAKYGQPKRVSFTFTCTLKEYNRIKSSQKNERNHDVTLYIRKDDKYIVIAKHFYPQGMFRSMSGGIHQNEDFITGAKREAREETGCEIAIKSFLLRTDVRFVLHDDPTTYIDWRSFVFLADYKSGDFQFSDKDEIREVRAATLEEFDTYSKIMLSLDIAGLRYRAALHDEVKKLLPTV